jgi:hypothetical protein
MALTSEQVKEEYLYKPGDRISHLVHGIGTIAGIVENPCSKIYKVCFEKGNNMMFVTEGLLTDVYGEDITE